MENIHPIFDRTLGRADRESLLGQRGIVLWLYGLSGSGKSTIAAAVERRFHAEGKLTKLLDGDNIRSGLNRGLGFSDADREENIRRIAEVAKLFLHTGVITLASFITPTRSLRQLARDIVGESDFHEVFVDCPFEVCAERDVKGLYAKANSGKITAFTGKDSSFERPDSANLVIETDKETVDSSVDRLYTYALESVAR